MMTACVKIRWVLPFVVLYLINSIAGGPLTTDKSLVVSSTTIPTVNKDSEKELEPTTTQQPIHIHQMQVTAKVSNRYVHTTVLSKVKNHDKKAQEATFSIVLPDSAFISGFTMEIDGKNYTAYVKEKEEAKKVYEEAVASGQSAAHVAVSARDSNRFTVSVNVEPESKAAFYLNYEELLKRQENHYELIINLHPGEPVKDLSVKVEISESRKITDLKVPPLRSGNEIGNEKAELDPRADIHIIDEKNVVVTFSPNIERQKQLAGVLGTKEENGLAGQFVVQYDVERDPQGGEVIIQGGYFVHYFAPSELQPLPKYVVFVLDTSGSMYGEKIQQLRESMEKILGDLNEQDIFQLVEFNSAVQVLNINDPSKNVRYPIGEVYGFGGEAATYPPLHSIEFRPPYPANAENINKAKSAVKNLNPDGSTDIYTGLEVGLHLVELAKRNNATHQPLVIFLTDGQPNVRVHATDEITSKISEYNSGKRKSAIYTLAFGNFANKDFLQKLASRNYGFSRQIYEAADASLQLQNFYKQISSPLLADVTFKYEPSTTSLTITEFPIHFGGSEIVVAGCYSKPEFIPPIIEGRGKHGWVILKPTVYRSVSSVERLWAYLTVKQLLDKKEISDKDADDLKKKALDLALKYQFVTPLSSLVVVKPNATNAVDTEAADKQDEFQHRPLHSRPGIALQSLGGAGFSAFDSVAAMPGIPGPPPPQYSTTPYIPTYVPLFTTTVTEATSTETTPTDIFLALHWLNQLLTNGVISLSKGHYKLGLTEVITDKVECSNAPQNVTAHCTLLGACKKVHSLLVSQDIYEKHFCVLKNEYAGVCCPDVA